MAVGGRGGRRQDEAVKGAEQQLRQPAQQQSTPDQLMERRGSPGRCWQILNGTLLLIQRMGGFLVTIASVTAILLIFLWSVGQLGLVSCQVTPSVDDFDWRQMDPQDHATPSTTPMPVAVPTASDYVDDCSALDISSKQQFQCHMSVLEETRSRLQSITDRIDRMERMLNGKFPPVKFRTYRTRKRILVTGGAGFVGSHLVDHLMLDGHEVTVVDNLFTGRRRNIETWIGHDNFQFVRHDVVVPYFAEVDEIYHLASPASPPHYMANPVKTIKTNTIGTINMLGLAKRVGARLLVASTSEVYGDPEVHPQPENYWGHVNPIGPRACYDEGKRLAETLSFAYLQRNSVSVTIARIFNTYGPRMHNNDGRVVSNFILQALENKPLTIYGSGLQTRSFQYVSDLVEGLVGLMASNHSGPVNIGNPDEHTIEEFAEIIQATVGGNGGIQYLEAKEDDPRRRRPNITRAKKLLNWQPKVTLAEGIRKTVEFFRHELQRKHHDQRNIYDPLIDWPHVSEECTKDEEHLEPHTA